VNTFHSVHSPFQIVSAGTFLVRTLTPLQRLGPSTPCHRLRPVPLQTPPLAPIEMSLAQVLAICRSVAFHVSSARRIGPTNNGPYKWDGGRTFPPVNLDPALPAIVPALPSLRSVMRLANKTHQGLRRTNAFPPARCCSPRTEAISPSKLRGLFFCSARSRVPWGLWWAKGRD